MLPHRRVMCLVYFFFNDTATTEIYTLSLHDALPISPSPSRSKKPSSTSLTAPPSDETDRKSTRLNSSHMSISYAVFCLKKTIHNAHDRPLAHFLHHVSDDIFAEIFK